MMKYIGSKLAIESVNKDKSHGSFCHGAEQRKEIVLASKYQVIFQLWQFIVFEGQF